MSAMDRVNAIFNERDRQLKAIRDDGGDLTNELWVTRTALTDAIIALAQIVDSEIDRRER
jgi:hypothetical protein